MRITARIYQILELYEERIYSSREAMEELTPELPDPGNVKLERVHGELLKIKGTRFFILTEKTPV